MWKAFLAFHIWLLFRAEKVGFDSMLLAWKDG